LAAVSEKPKKYVVLGSAGQLGRDLCPRLAGEVVALTRADVDLTRPDGLRATLENHRPEIVINCAAYNLVDRAESEPAAAFEVNAWGVRQLAIACRDLGCTLVHFSTDYIFGLRALCPRQFVIRTCGLYGVWGSGGKGGNFVESMLRRAAEGKPLRVVADQVCTPSYTVDVATALAALVQTDQFGLYHLTNAGSCTWHEFAKTIFEQAGFRANLTPITSQEWGAVGHVRLHLADQLQPPAQRPSYSVLANSAYEGLGLTPPRPWQEALMAYLQERQICERDRLNSK
jgi:dTDP-4-dehydrorhamnose reductase